MLNLFKCKKHNTMEETKMGRPKGSKNKVRGIPKGRPKKVVEVKKETSIMDEIDALQEKRTALVENALRDIIEKYKLSDSELDDAVEEARYACEC